MEKKLLSILFIFSLFFLNPVEGFGQCPTSVGVTASPGTTICAGESITFTANTSGGSFLEYQWLINGAEAQTGASPTFTTTSLTNGQKVMVIVTSTGGDQSNCPIQSSEVPITVNPIRTVTATISANYSNICPGETVNFTISSQTNIGSGSQYEWRVNGVSQGTTATFSSNNLGAGDQIQLWVDSSVPCTAPILSNTISITEKPGTPAVPSDFTTSEAAVCPETSQTYTVPVDNTASEYIWTYPSGWTGSSTTNSITVTSGNSGSGTITVKAKNSCGTSEARSLAVSVKAGTPATPGTISGGPGVCPGVPQTFSITAVTGATSYEWSFPTGWTGSSTSTSITLTPTAGTAVNGNLSVTATNDCGTSSARTLAISVKPGTPDQPAAFTAGPAALCPGTDGTYTVPSVAGATQYIWTLPTGFSSSSLTTTTPTLVLTAGSSGSGNITVKATNDCGTGTERSMAISINPPKPVMTAEISGSTGVCASTSSLNYSIPAIANATSYEWAITGTGWQITSGAGTSQITVTSGTTGGTISVKAINSCGDSASKSVTVNLNPPPPVMAGEISGLANVCAGSTGNTYAIPSITGATSYSWTTPSGWSLTGGQNSNAITVTAGSTGGNISVTAVNGCGSSTIKTFPVTTTSGVPAQPGNITVSNLSNNSICPPIENVIFEVPIVTGITDYVWVMPNNNWVITSGEGTRRITVKINASQTYQSPVQVRVRAKNICGESVERVSQDFFLDNFVVTDAGVDRTLCKSLNQVFIDGEVRFGNQKFTPTFKATDRNNGTGFSNTPNNTNGTFTYRYTPIQADLDRGFVTIRMTVPQPSGGGPNKACGPGEDEMTITFRNIPTASIATPAAICTGISTSLTVTGTPNSKVTYSKGSQTGLTIDIGSSGSATIPSGTLTANTAFTLTGITYTDAPVCSNTLNSSATVTVTQKPTATISYAGPFCKSLNTAQTPTLSGTNAYTGGTYTATGDLTSKINAASGAFTPSNVAAGTYTVTYITPASGGCEAVTATTEITITPLPTASINYENSPYCSSDSTDKSVTLTGTNAYTGGTYSSTNGLDINPTTGVIKAANSEPDTYTVTYTVPAASGCDVVTATAEVTITEIPTPQISYTQAEICKEDTNTYSAAVAGSGIVTGGTFTAPSGLSITSAGVITPSTSTPGIYKVTYTLSAANGCAEITAETEVNITAVPSVETSYAGPFCESTTGSKQVTFTNGIGAYENGSFTVSPSGLTIDATTGAITPSSSDPEVYTVTYTIPANRGCDIKTAETTVNITAVPKATISYNDAPFCAADASSYEVTFTNTTGNYEIGTFSGTTGLLINSNTGEITPVGSTAGTHTVTYTIPTAEGCEAVTTTVDVIIYQEVSINSQPFNIGTCTGEEVQFEVSAAGDGLYYQWYKGTYPGSAINGATSNIYNINTVTFQNDGIYYVEVSGTAPCEPVRSDEVTLNVDENIIVDVSPQDENICLNDDVTFYAEASANGGEVTYQWRHNGVDLTGENNPSLTLTNVQSNQAGEYSVYIEGPQGYTCSSIETSAVTLTVYEPPMVDAGLDFEVCSTETSIAIGNDATATNHTSLLWITNGAGTISNPTDLTGATYAPVAADLGNTLIFTLTGILEVEGVQICSDAVDTKEITIVPQPEITAFTYTSTLTDTATEFCETDTAVKSPITEGTNLDNGTGVFTVDNPELVVDSNGAFTPNGTDPGVYIITYTFNATSTTAVCTEVSRDFTVTIGAKPVADFTYGGDPFCSDSENISPTFLNDGIAGSFSSSAEIVFVDVLTGEINIAESTPGTYDVINTVDNSADGCAIVTHTASITINEKPIPDFSYAETEFCSDPTTPVSIDPILETNAVKGVFSYSSTVTGANLVMDSDGKINITTSAEGTYTITNSVETAEDGCDSVSAEFTITIDKLPVASFSYAGLSAENSICISNLGATIETSPDAGGTYSISGPSTEVKVDATTGNLTWSAAEIVPGIYTVTYTIAEGTVCDEVTHSETFTINALPVGGVLTFTGVGRVFTTCENAVDGYAAPLVLTGEIGQVVEWQYKTANSSTWSIYNSQNSQLSSEEVEDLVNNTSTVFRAKITNGSCSSGIFSATAIVSVIPSNIKPSPVEAEPTIVCFGTDISLSSKTGYGESFGKFEGGDFTSAGIKNNGWDFAYPDGSEVNYNASANSGEPNPWHKTQPKWKFETASINDPYTLTDMWWNPLSDGKQNEHFAITQGAFSSNMDTPPFTLTGIDEAKVTFDQAFNLTTGSTIRVVLFKNGTELKELYKITGPATSDNYEGFGSGTPGVNNMSFDLGSYLGEANLKIRFEYTGVRRGDVWAVDNIKVPEGPQGVLLQWFYDDNPNDSDIEQIGDDNDEVVEFTPRKIGWNDFEVKTALLLDSNGNACESLDNFERIRVFVFDTYETTVEVIPAECGSYSATLNASINGGLQGGELNESEVTFDGYRGEWKIVSPEGVNYTLRNQNENSGLEPAKDPNIVFESEDFAVFIITWELIPTAVYPEDYPVVELRGELIENSACPPIPIPVTPEFTDCTTLDFDGEDDVIVVNNPFTGVKAIEAWIRPEPGEGTIISGPTFDITTPAGLTPNSRWYHLAVIFVGEESGLYIDGIRKSDAPSGNAGGTRTSIGAKWTSAETESSDHYSGWIEEMRIWKNAPTLKEIRFMMNQRLKLNGEGTDAKVVTPLEGEVVPNKPIAGSYYTANGYNLDEDGDAFYNQTANDLFAYYRLISEIPDPTLGVIPNTYKPVNGNTPDLSLSGIPGRLNNMTTHQENTSPTPYFSAADGAWEVDNTWARPTVWDPPHTENIEWNIVRISNDITSGNKDIIVLGLISDTGNKLLEIFNPSGGAKDENNSGQYLRITHYLELDGNIDLIGESQLLQNQGSILADSSKGYLDRDQQGKRNSFVYNYWSSPVSAQGTANNAPYSVKSVLMDGTIASNPQNITFIYDYWAADGATTSNPITISTYWLWGYSPAEANIYAEWDHILENGTLKTGEGFTMKGTNGSAGINGEQNYTFRGKPHNGDILLQELAPNQNYLIGNPYPSALDTHKFIDDNLILTNGTLYFWDHFKIVDHILLHYVGGYATLTKLDAVPAASIDDRINNDVDEEGSYFESNTLPKRYIPVGQGFMINSTESPASGKIKFSNSQREFIRESLGESTFLKPEVVVKTGKNKSEEFKKIRLSFSSPVGYHRQILLGAVPTATDGFDLGYDAHLFDDNIEDMYFLQGENKLVIQAVADFNKDRVIPLGIKVNENKEFRIRLDTLENGNEEMNIYLNDKLKDSIHDLRASAYISTSEPGTIHDRFEIIFFKDEPLPPVAEIPGDEKPGDVDDAFIVSLRHAHNNRELQILNPQELNISAMYLFDFNGNQLEAHTEISNDKEVRMPVKNYSSGVYIVQLIVEGRVISKRIIINN